MCFVLNRFSFFSSFGYFDYSFILFIISVKLVWWAFLFCSFSELWMSFFISNFTCIYSAVTLILNNQSLAVWTTYFIYISLYFENHHHKKKNVRKITRKFENEKRYNKKFINHSIKHPKVWMNVYSYIVVFILKSQRISSFMCPFHSLSGTIHNSALNIVEPFILFFILFCLLQIDFSYYFIFIFIFVYTY